MRSRLDGQRDLYDIIGTVRVALGPTPAAEAVAQPPVSHVPITRVTLLARVVGRRRTLLQRGVGGDPGGAHDDRGGEERGC